MTAPLVSVIIPVHNGERFLEKTLASAVEQTYAPIEIIVVDDGSTDASSEIVRRHGSRVTLISQRNAGVASARNAGLARARGDFVAFLDQDDWWRSDKTSRQVAVFLQDADVGLVHTNVVHFDDASQSFTDRLHPASVSAALVGQVFDRLVLGNGIYNSSVMVRRTVLDRVGPFDTRMAGNTVQDYELWLRLAPRCAFAYLEDELTFFRLHRDQGTWHRRAMLLDEVQLLDRVIGPEALMARRDRRLRVAALLDELSREQMLAGDARGARQVSRRLLRMRRDPRSAVLVVLALLPVPATKWLFRRRDVRVSRRLVPGVERPRA